MIHFCTYFDRNYLSRGLVLYRSLLRHSPDFTLWILCLDDATHAALTKLAAPQIRLIRLSEFEHGDEALLAAKANRSTVEYYFTCTPSLALYVLKQAPDAETITYVDADIMFFSSPAAVFEELGERSIGIVPHAFPPKLRSKEVYGRFNVGLLAFRNDTAGRACLARWRVQCLEWCYDRLEGDRFADQKYLDAWPALYDVCVFENPGLVTAPWNFMQFDIREADGRPFIDGHELVFYHYQGFKLVRPWLFDLGLGGYGAMRRGTRLLVYGPYVREIKNAEAWTAATLDPAAQRSGPAARSNPWRNRLRMLRNLMRGQFMVASARFQL